MQTLEWWPDYGEPPLWIRQGSGGTRADLASLGLGGDLVGRLLTWSEAYDDDKLPIDGPGDPLWIEVGTALLAETRDALRGRYSVVVTEPWWGEPPAE